MKVLDLNPEKRLLVLCFAVMPSKIFFSLPRGPTQALDWLVSSLSTARATSSWKVNNPETWHVARSAAYTL